MVSVSYWRTSMLNSMKSSGSACRVRLRWPINSKWSGLKINSLTNCNELVVQQNLPQNTVDPYGVVGFIFDNIGSYLITQGHEPQDRTSWLLFWIWWILLLPKKFLVTTSLISSIVPLQDDGPTSTNEIRRELDSIRWCTCCPELRLLDKIPSVLPRRSWWFSAEKKSRAG